MSPQLTLLPTYTSKYSANGPMPLFSRDHAACYELDRQGDAASLGEQQRDQNEDLHCAGLGGRSGAEQHADEGSR